MSSAIANSYGLAFSISPAKPKKPSKEDDENEEYVLTLAPFTKAPKINFGQVKPNTLVERNLLIINPQQFEVKLNVQNQELAIDNMEIIIAKMTNVNFKIKWQPDKPDNYKYSILFEVTNNARLKFLVHAFGICTAPVVKKPIRKPLSTFQPLKKEKSAVFNDQQATNKQKPAITVSKSTDKENKQGVKKSATLAATITTTTTNSTTTNAKTPTFELRTLPPSKSLYNMENDQNYQKPLKAPSMYDIYSTSPENPDPIFTSINSQPNIADLRRQTCIIASPRINKQEKYIGDHHMTTTITEVDSNTPVRRCYSQNNISSPTNNSYSFIDKTVVVVASDSDHNQKSFNNNLIGSFETITNSTCLIATSATRKDISPQIYSTLKKVSDRKSVV